MGKYSIRKLPSDILLEISEKVRELRKQQGLSQQKLAEKSGVSFGSIKRFETTGQISFVSLLKICDVLGRLSDFEQVLNSNPTDNIENLFSS